MIKEVYESVRKFVKTLENEKEKYVHNPKIDFTRLRKISFSDCILSVCCMSGGTLFSELLEYYQDSENLPSVSALLQQRSKLKYHAFEDFFKLTVSLNQTHQFYQGYRLLAVDGSDIQIPLNSKDEDTFFSGTNGQKPYNLVHLNTMYDILSNSYLDVVVQDRKNWAEHEALNQMVDRSDIGLALVMADRGYESYNVMAHIQEKGWKYLLRVKDLSGNGIVSRLQLPQDPCFDMDIDLQITRKLSNETKRLFLDRNHYRYTPPNSKFDYLPPHSKYKEDAVFYRLPFRVVRFEIAENQYETLLTNLDRDSFPADELKRLYAMRWGVETSFRTLKYNVGLIYFHSWKKNLVMQELFARLAMYNITSAIAADTTPSETEKLYAYKINAAQAVIICRKLFLNRISPHLAEKLLSRSVVPVRVNRTFRRKNPARIAINFIYRIA